MGFSLTSPAPKKCDPTAENRVWGFFGEQPQTSRENRPQSLQPRQGNRLAPTTIASGRTYWPSRDPIEERGGVNLYHVVFNSAINYVDLLGLDFLHVYICDNIMVVTFYTGEGYQGEDAEIDWGIGFTIEGQGRWWGRSGKEGKSNWKDRNQSGPTPPGWFMMGEKKEEGKMVPSEKNKSMTDGKGCAFKRPLKPIPNRGNPPHTRTGLLVHPDGDNDGTLGCMGILPEHSASFERFTDRYEELEVYVEHCEKDKECEAPESPTHY